MMSSMPLTVAAMILAERLIREEKTNKVSIIGSFTDLGGKSFPLGLFSFSIYVCLFGDGIKGEHTFELRAEYQDGQPATLPSPVTGKPTFQSLPGTNEVCVNFNNYVFPRPGLVWFVFSVDGAELARRHLHLTQASPPQEGHNA